MRTFWLNFHAAYSCHHSGACCSSGWPIPVERDRVIPIRSLAARADETWLIPVENAPEDVAGTLAVRPNGECTFFQIPTSTPLPTSSVLPTDVGLPTSVGVPTSSALSTSVSLPTRSVLPTSVTLPAGSCSIHRARPSSCAHFPYVCLIDSRGVRVTLSHYCPTAASMLFAHDGPIEIVEGPPPIAGLDVPEGLDARESLPPPFVETSTSAKATSDRTPDRTADGPAGKSHPAKLRLMSWDEFSEWEQRAITGSVVGAEPPALALFELARFAVPFPWSWAEAPADLEEGWNSLVAPVWPDFTPVVQRYRAAKLFASWAAYTDAGLAAVVRVADIADAVLRVEAVRQCMAAQRRLDAELLKEAIRQSDLLLVHYADGWVLSSGSTP